MRHVETLVGPLDCGLPLRVPAPPRLRLPHLPARGERVRARALHGRERARRRGDRPAHDAPAHLEPALPAERVGRACRRGAGSPTPAQDGRVASCSCSSRPCSGPPSRPSPGRTWAIPSPRPARRGCAVGVSAPTRRSSRPSRSSWRPTTRRRSSSGGSRTCSHSTIPRTSWSSSSPPTPRPIARTNSWRASLRGCASSAVRAAARWPRRTTPCRRRAARCWPSRTATRPGRPTRCASSCATLPTRRSPTRAGSSATSARTAPTGRARTGATSCGCGTPSRASTR